MSSQKPEILLKKSFRSIDKVRMQFVKIASQESQLVTRRHRGGGGPRSPGQPGEPGDISCADPTADFTLHKADNRPGYTRRLH